MTALSFLLLLILIALIFEFINGFHDTANSIATVVATKVLSPTHAVLLAAVMNLIGALMGVEVAKTITSGIVNADILVVTSEVLICALTGGILWNLLTWWLGLPSSSSHALIGGLCGAALAAANSNWAVLIWSKMADGESWYKAKGLLWKVVVPMISSPIAGFTLGIIIIAALYASISFLSMRGGALTRVARPKVVNAFFGKAQLVSSGYMGWAHGFNDAQKTMGIIALAIVGTHASGGLDHLPSYLSFLAPDPNATPGSIAVWIKIVCAIVMAAGTAIGGWRIIKTLGHKMVKLHPIHGFAAETASATILFTTGIFGMPVSTTHSISTAIMGVGFAKSANALRWTVIERILWAWVLTIPATALVAFLLVKLMQNIGVIT